MTFSFLINNGSMSKLILLSNTFLNSSSDKFSSKSLFSLKSTCISWLIILSIWLCSSFVSLFSNSSLLLDWFSESFSSSFKNSSKSKPLDASFGSSKEIEEIYSINLKYISL